MAWTQDVGACSSKSIPPEFETYCRALETNKNGSLAHYWIAELLFLQNNLQSSANEFRVALSGDLDPKWTEVWAHIGLSKIFEMTGQRDRALNECKQAWRTGDNTFAAQDEVSRLIKKTFRLRESLIRALALNRSSRALPTTPKKLASRN
jgi:tetratricopeptide (TPR) repeat protein